MDLFLEILLYIVVGPIIELFENPIEDSLDSINKRKLPKWVKVLLAVLFVIALIGMFFLIFFGIALLTGSNEEKTVGLILLLTGLVLFITYTVVAIIRVNVRNKRRKLNSPDGK